VDCLYRKYQTLLGLLADEHKVRGEREGPKFNFCNGAGRKGIWKKKRGKLGYGDLTCFGKNEPQEAKGTAADRLLTCLAVGGVSRA